MELAFIPPEDLPQRLCQATTIQYQEHLFRTICTCGWTSGYWTRRKFAEESVINHLKGM